MDYEFSCGITKKYMYIPPRKSVSCALHKKYLDPVLSTAASLPVSVILNEFSR